MFASSRRFLLVMGVCGIAAIAGAQAVPGDALPEPSEDAVRTDGDAGATASAVTSEATEQQPDIAELRRRLDLLAEEVERLLSGEAPQDELSADEARAIGF